MQKKKNYLKYEKCYPFHNDYISYYCYGYDKNAPAEKIYLKSIVNDDGSWKIFQSGADNDNLVYFEGKSKNLNLAKRAVKCQILKMTLFFD
jgi:hypothetical protein